MGGGEPQSIGVPTLAREGLLGLLGHRCLRRQQAHQLEAQRDGLARWPVPKGGEPRERSGELQRGAVPLVNGAQRLADLESGAERGNGPAHAPGVAAVVCPEQVRAPEAVLQHGELARIRRTLEHLERAVIVRDGSSEPMRL